MSRAFVKDGAESEVTLPDRPLSPHRNLVTRRGLEQLRAAVARYQSELSAASTATDRTAAANASRELRYWSARLATAELAEPPPDIERVVFGVLVTVLDEDDGEHTWQLVGEDEADPAEGRISWVSPVARALLGAEVGDVRQLPTREVEVLAIRCPEPAPARSDAPN